MLFEVLAAVFIAVGLGHALFAAKYVDGKNKREIVSEKQCAMTGEERQKEILRCV